MTILEIGVIFDSNGIDIHLLNRDGANDVKDPLKIRALFADPPTGYTPLVPALRYVFQHPAATLGHEKKLLVLIATDGAPTDEQGNDQTRELGALMRNERCANTTHVQFLICTDDAQQMAYLSGGSEQPMKNVSVTRDYHHERALIQQQLGSDYSFS